jgi:hypothetical protein
MRQNTIDSRNPDTLARYTTRPMWYTAFALISVIDFAMILLMMLVPDYAALWLAILLAVSVIGGVTYKSHKYLQPLPSDNMHRKEPPTN